MSDFEKYRKRNERLKKLEELFLKTKTLMISMKLGHEVPILRCYADVKELIAEIDRLPPPERREL